MLAFVLAGLMLCIFFFFVTIFFIWVLRQYLQASQYRKLVKLAKETPQTPKEPQWRITYREGKGSSKSITVPASSEKEALGSFLSKGIRYKTIDAVEQI